MSTRCTHGDIMHNVIVSRPVYALLRATKMQSERCGCDIDDIKTREETSELLK